MGISEKGANAAKIGFAHEKYLCRMSEKSAKIEIKRMRKEDKRVTCKISPKMIEGEIHEDFTDPISDIIFEPGQKSLELDYQLPLVLSDQVSLSIFHFFG